MFNPLNDPAPLEQEFRCMLLFSVDPVPGLVHHDLRPLLAYSTGSVHTQIRPFDRTTVENQVYFAIFLLRLRL